jgi:exodeoxyribonuclease V gamma subunit
MDADAGERESFSIDKLDGYAIYHEWIEGALNGKPLTVKKLQAQGRWLAGVPGELEFQRQQRVIAGFVERITARKLGARLDDFPVDISIGQYRLVGKLGNRYQHGSLIYRYTDLKGKDFIGALLHHAVINQVQQQSSYVLSTDEDLVLLPEHCQSVQLSALLDIYQLGRKQPNAFFTEAALAYIKQAHKQTVSNHASKSALDTAIEQLSRATQQPYEPELRRLYGNVADFGLVLGESFEQQCRNLLLPVWEAIHSGS